jgi:hypothetical protein
MNDRDLDRKLAEWGDVPGQLSIEDELGCTCGTRCCKIHKTHTDPHMGCILR